jgi:hypothetical protein
VNRTPSSPVRALAAATSALVDTYDVTDVLAGMLPRAVAVLGARAAGILVVQDGASMELLSSTSHAASEIELYQAQASEGPCVDCVAGPHPVSVFGKEDLVSRWPSVGPAMVESGYLGVHAEPLRWHGRALGGLNLFFASEEPLTDDAKALAQAFADITALALVQTQDPSDRELAAHIRAALDARTLVEQAKGVLMQSQGLHPGSAYEVLRQRAAEQAVTVTEMAHNLVWRAHAD